jgi:hypothetical protein
MTLTIVSGYWIVKNKHDMKYLKWFQNSLKIHCPYVFFGDAETIELIKPFREGYPTHYIECKIEDFYCYKYRDRFRVDPIHCPSIELAMIWNEKLFLIERAAQINPFSSEFFMWVDAGICNYRNTPPPPTPFPNPIKLSAIPINKLIFTSSCHKEFKREHVGSHLDHYVSGTYLIHKSVIGTFIELYKAMLEQYTNPQRIITDQIIFTYIYDQHPELFHKLGHGYGALIPLLY